MKYKNVFYLQKFKNAIHMLVQASLIQALTKVKAGN